MCLIAIAWQARSDLPLIVAANRDEWRDRPAKPAHWWPDRPELFAGRDLEAGGTWMGVTRGGRFAAVTNFRDPADRRAKARSRGTLWRYARAASPKAPSTRIDTGLSTASHSGCHCTASIHQSSSVHSAPSITPSGAMALAVRPGASCPTA